MIEQHTATNDSNEFHVLTVGWGHKLVEQLFAEIADKSPHTYSHIVHPEFVADTWPRRPIRDGMYFFRDDFQQPMPSIDRNLLASLEQNCGPTLHNMILGDRVLSKIDYHDALRYATFIARRLIKLYSQIQPNVVIVGFDAVHSSLAFSVAKQMNIPIFALHFSVLPQGLACFCDRMSPAAHVQLNTDHKIDSESLAATSLDKFLNRQISAHAFVAPIPSTIGQRLVALSQRFVNLFRTIRRSRSRGYLQYTEKAGHYDLAAAISVIRKRSNALKAISAVHTLADPPSDPYVFFALHLQPESSIDVWAPFFSNQMWVIELLSRSIPASHKLLVKLHKSDTANYSNDQLDKMAAFPGVEIVRPFADTRNFLEKASLVVAIQGTIGLEAALLGKPVIMLGESPVSRFPSASSIGKIADLPVLIRKKMSERQPGNSEIVRSYASFLEPFLPASLNNWRVDVRPDEIDDYVVLFDALHEHLRDGQKTDRLFEIRDVGA